MRDMSAEELIVFQALFDGDLEPLSSLLKSESPDVHPLVQRQICRLIAGNREEVDFKLIAQPLPKVTEEYVDERGKKRKVLSHHAQARRDAEGMKIALVMVRHGALNGSWDAAVEDTMKELKIGRTKVTEHWGEQKGFMKFMQKSRERADRLGLPLPE